MQRLPTLTAYPSLLSKVPDRDQQTCGHLRQECLSCKTTMNMSKTTMNMRRCQGAELKEALAAECSLSLVPQTGGTSFDRVPNAENRPGAD